MNKHINLPDSIVDYINDYQEEHHLATFTMALCMIVEQSKKEQSLEEKIVNRIENDFDKLFTRIRLGVTTSDKNIQMLLECINAIATKYEIKPMPTNVLESDLLKDSRKVVNERIATYKQKNDWKKNHKIKKGGSEEV